MTGMKRATRLAALTVVAVACLSAATIASATASATRSGRSTASPPAGPATTTVNDFTCRPTRAHPYPVVLVHGTLEDMSMWAGLEPSLTAQGYCVFALNYGNNGTGDIATSAGQLGTFVDQVTGATHARRVDLVGHSQGGMMPRYYLRFLGGAGKVHQLIGLAPSNYGTTLSGLDTLTGCVACQEQAQGSDFLNTLNAGWDTVPGVFFTVIATNKDEIVTPYTNTFLHGPGAWNIVIQKICPADASGHVNLATSDENAWQLVRDALDPRHARPVHCVPATNAT